MICLSSNLSSTLLSLVILSIHECDSSSFILGKIHPKIPILIHPLYRFLTCQFALSMVLLSTSPLYCKKSNTHPSPTLHSVIHATAQHSSTSVSPVQPSPSIHPSLTEVITRGFIHPHGDFLCQGVVLSLLSPLYCKECIFSSPLFIHATFHQYICLRVHLYSGQHIIHPWAHSSEFVGCQPGIHERVGFGFFVNCPAVTMYVTVLSSSNDFIYLSSRIHPRALSLIR